MFSQNLKKLRTRRDLKQSDVAKAIGTTQKQVSKWETGNLEPDIRSLCLLADYFGVSIDYLVDHVTPQSQDIDARMRELLDTLTPEQVALLCMIAAKALENRRSKK